HHDVTARHRAARARRRVCHPRALPDGMASIYTVLPAPDAIALDLALDGAARTARAHGDHRTLDQLRADTLATLGTHALTQGGLGTPPTTTDADADTGDATTATTADADAGTAPDTRSNTDHSDNAAGPDADAEVEAGTDPDADIGTDPDADADIGTDPDADADIGTDPDGDAGAGVGDVGGGGPPDTASLPGAGGAGPPGPAAPWFPIGQVAGVPVRVNVTVPLTTLLGGTEPGTLDGYGPIDPATARALALGGTWRRLVTDPLSGQVLDLGTT
ncbi:DUF222 domain-containing protein, partial [Georgenia sp. SYP-B2076]|uniref:DUF222 domain-containing protein n=1 Tax=Georgenia sp. SYP-B2076 TaxID=2495881 RepID=UPI000F8C9508